MQPTSLCALDPYFMVKEEVDLRSLPRTVSFRETKGVSSAQTVNTVGGHLLYGLEK